MTDFVTKLIDVTNELIIAGQECSCNEGNNAAAVRSSGYQKAALGVMNLKALNRQISISLDSRRREIEQYKEKVDSLHLKLENLLYKKAYLLREIRECRDFSTPSLKSVEEETNKEIAARKFTQHLPKLHQQAIEFLETEMQLRDRAKKTLEERKSECQSREEVLDGRRKIVDELPGRITRVEVAVIQELNPIFERSDAAMEVNSVEDSADS